MNVQDKIVIVTGASSGIGLATAKLLAEHGARVVLVSRSKEKLEKLSKEIPLSIAIDADMTKISDIKRVVEQTQEHFGRIDMQQVIPIMRKLGGGAIINISSGSALMYLPNMGAYSASKRALAKISLTAREELKKNNIIISVVYPYITLTDFENNTIKEPANNGGEQAGNAPFPPNSAELVAHKILDGIESGAAEIFVHDWMKKMSIGN